VIAPPPSGPALRQPLPDGTLNAVAIKVRSFSTDTNRIFPFRSVANRRRRGSQTTDFARKTWWAL